MATAGISAGEVAKANAELHRMRHSLQKWLYYRNLNDQVAAGTRPTSKPQALAIQIARTSRDWATEQKLADHLHVLLGEVMPDAALPDPNVTANPQAAVTLAQIAISGQPPVVSPTPIATSGVSPPWLWPVLIVGGVLLAVTTAISSMADVAKSKEEYACIQAGACTDYGFWLKAAAIAVGGWFAWTQLGVGAKVKSLLAGKGG